VEDDDKEEPDRDKEDDDKEEENEVVVPVMLNCWDWARMAAVSSLTKLIVKPLPIGQPAAGPFTVVEPREVLTFPFKTELMFGNTCCEERSTGANSG
jgi:hypothetical protein